MPNKDSYLIQRLESRLRQIKKSAETEVCSSIRAESRDVARGFEECLKMVRAIDENEKLIKVGVFLQDGKDGTKPGHYTAYTTWYNPDWGDCQTIEVYAKNGTEAKHEAKSIAAIKARRKQSGA